MMKLLKKLFLGLLISSVTTSLALGSGKRIAPDKSNELAKLNILLGLSVKEYCSCVNVMGIDQRYCEALTKLPNWPAVTIEEIGDGEYRSTLKGFSRTAVYVDSYSGCRLETLMIQRPNESQ